MRFYRGCDFQDAPKERRRGRAEKGLSKRVFLKGAEKKRTLQKHPFGQPFLRTTPSPLLWRAQRFRELGIQAWHELCLWLNHEAHGKKHPSANSLACNCRLLQQHRNGKLFGVSRFEPFCENGDGAFSQHLLMGLFRGAVFHHGGVSENCPLASMGFFPSLMGRFPSLVGRSPECLNGLFSPLD